MRLIRLFVYTVILCIGITSCTKHQEDKIPSPGRAVYYWKTIFKLGDAEKNVLKQQAVKKIYLRYFDVDYNKQGVPVPVGTVQFEAKVPKGIKIIPVVYIENHCLDKADGLAAKLVKRVLTMSSANGIASDELQIDCDWTKTSQQTYFSLLREIRKSLDAEGHYTLSATIRLHQLAQTAPPVDYGVLMCYNTGNLRNYQTANAILDPKDVLPFVNHYLQDYPLSLCAAYPLFSWNLLFERGQFRAILRDVNLADATLYKKVSDKRYIVLRSHSVSIPDPNSFGLMVRAGDEIKVDEVSAQTIRKMQSMLERKRPQIDRQVILFSLNSIPNIKLTSNEMVQIFSH